MEAGPRKPVTELTTSRPLEPEPSKSLPPQGDPAGTSIARSLLHKGNKPVQRVRTSDSKDNETRKG